MFMRADVNGTGNFTEERSRLVCDMKKHDGQWRLFSAKP
jgi:hypothetical protein